MRCAGCGAENAEPARFCEDCGSPLGVTCPNCGATGTPGKRYCRECGTPLSATTPTAGVPAQATGPAGAAPAAERRLVSVLFVDLVGFTPMSAARDAEDVRELLSRYFETARSIIERYGGTVEKFIGDAVMAVWGTPTAKEDDSERAVRAALDLVSAVPALGVPLGNPQLQARAAVVTGEAAVNLAARGQGMVAGDLVNTASRLQSAAPPGRVLVDEPTRRASAAAISYEDAGPFELKGKSEPLAASRAIRVVAGRGGALRAAGLEAPFVGREREMRLLKELLHTVTVEQHAQHVSVVGVAGVGKTRLSREFEKHVDGLAASVLWHRGRCLSYGDGVTYWALAEMVRMRARITEDEPPEPARQKLAAVVGRYVTDPEQAARVVSRLSALLGLEDRGETERQDLFATWRLFFESMADQAPTALVFEDVQWADPALTDFINYLLEWSRSHQLFVLTISRPEGAERLTSPGLRQRNFTSIFLEPLPAEAMDELLEGLVPGVPAELRHRIRDRAEGIPLYAVETVRMLIDRGLLVRDGDQFNPTGEIGSLDVPENLQALIAARLDELTSAERSLVQNAAVLGQSFTLAGLAAVTGLSEPAMVPLLTMLVRKDLLCLQDDPRSPERGQYAFLQALVRKVAYDTLSRRDRGVLHVRAAEFLERAPRADEAEVAEVVAAHYLEAMRAAGPGEHADGLAGRAAAALIRAAERARSLAAPAQAQRHYERAAGLVADPVRHAELLESAGYMAETAGHADAARGHFETAMAAFEAIGRPHAAARAAAGLAQALWASGHIEQGLERMETAFSVLRDDEPDADLGHLAHQLGRLRFFCGQIQSAEEPVDLALRIAESLRLPGLLAEALNTKHLLVGERGRPEEAQALLRHALYLAEEEELPESELRARVNLSYTMTLLDRPQDAMAHDQAGIRLARRIGNRQAELMLLSHLPYSLFTLGRWDEALETIEQIPLDEARVHMLAIGSRLMPVPLIQVHRGEVELARRELEPLDSWAEGRDVQARSGFHCGLAVVLLAEGRCEEALQEAERAIELVQWQHVFGREAYLLAVEAALALADCATARRLLEGYESTPVGLRSRAIDAHNARFRAQLAVLEGQDLDDDTLYQRAGTAFRVLGFPFALAITLLENAEWQVATGRGDPASLLREARSIFAGLRATPWLDRLERSVASLSAVEPADSLPAP